MNSDQAKCELHGVDLERLERVAHEFALSLPHRVIIGLRGTLGAGKTRFTQAFAAACKVDQQQVTSPTFTIVQHYQGTRRIHHIDAYRLADEDEFIELGGEELLDDDASILIEWPQRIARCMPRETLYIDLLIEEDSSKRSVELSCGDASLMTCVHEIFTRLR